MSTVVNLTYFNPGLDPKKYKDHSERVSAGKNGGEEMARAAFYNPRNRKPSLPKLKFLESKE
jgi:hypothetical protein